MDYRLLLLKYINHVGQAEGVTFIGDGRLNNDLNSDVMFTPEEVAELERLDAEEYPQVSSTGR
jgi:hypothetical protein